MIEAQTEQRLNDQDSMGGHRPADGRLLNIAGDVEDADAGNNDQYT